MEVVLEAGAEEVRDAGDVWEVECSPEDFQSVKDAVDKAKIEVSLAELTMVPDTRVKLSEDSAKRCSSCGCDRRQRRRPKCLCQSRDR